MIKFFRKIRQQLLVENRLDKYLLYAIGEIILIVVGILIAIQINDSQNNKKKNELKEEYYLSLVAELDRDINLYKIYIDYSDKRIIEIDSIFSIINANNNIQKLKNHTTFPLLNVRLHHSTLNDIISSGNSEILDSYIRNKLFDLKTDTETYLQNLETNNSLCSLHISRFQEQIDTSYPTLKKVENELTKDWTLNPNSETFLRYTNMLNQLRIVISFTKETSERLLIKTQNLTDILNNALVE